MKPVTFLLFFLAFKINKYFNLFQRALKVSNFQAVAL